MNEEADQAGAPVDETPVGPGDVQAAVERATDSGLTQNLGAAPQGAPGTVGEAPLSQPQAPVIPAAAAADGPPLAEAGQTQAPRPPIVSPDPYPSAASSSDPATAQTVLQPQVPQAIPADPTVAGAPAGPASFVLPEQSQPPRDGEIRISADHPMAAFYTQSPSQPETRGNRGAGVLISLVATIAFCVLYAGVSALLLAPRTPPSRFLGELVAVLLSWPSVLAACAFLVGLVIVVLLVGRAGWWVYVLFGFLVALFVWVAAIAGVIIENRGFDGLFRLRLDEIVAAAFMPYVVVAVLVAREVTVWFGAWIGARGRRMTRANADAAAEYEAALAEAQAKPL